MHIFRSLKVSTGALLCSQSGREMRPVPRIDLSSLGKTTNSLRRLFQWLIDEARSEALSREDDYARVLFHGMQAHRLSQDDKATLNQYLFGHPDGPSHHHFLRMAA